MPEFKNLPEDLINWVELSRYLAKNESSISRTRSPKKYQAKINDLISRISEWKDEHV